MTSLVEWAERVAPLRHNPEDAKRVARYMLLWWTTPQVTRCYQTGRFVAYSSSMNDIGGAHEQAVGETEGDAICSLMIKLVALGAELRAHAPTTDDAGQ
ncbi:hypothetical protein [Phenylobacterium deserti]|uniref:Uncharacterized protein n=1 Tax=Phenylobacterium deserti TaxID=1914756 RepID=A0A328A9M3_9CAUL|nr:hypothetical protein [Phenylobacterium deserti]RAK51320.1 hypothetical protein DJ018_15360 [Phenylobacterium deserti]